MNSQVTIHIPSADNIAKTRTCHLMPFQVKCNGESGVSKYFEPVICHTEDGHVTASFRGKPLAGDEIKLPGEYSGVVIEQDHVEDSKCSHFKVTKRFDKFTYWNWDKDPSNNDKVKQALSWLNISKAINGSSELTESTPDHHCG